MIDLKARGILYHLKRPLFAASQLFAAKHIALYSYFVNDLLEENMISCTNYNTYRINGTNESIDLEKCSGYIYSELMNMRRQISNAAEVTYTCNLITKQLTAIRGKNEN